MNSMRVGISVTSADPNVLTRALEVLTRAGTGLMLEGMEGIIMWSEESDDE